MGLGLGSRVELGLGLDVAIRPSLATVLPSFRCWAAPSAAQARASTAACRVAVLMLVVACSWVWVGGWVDWYVGVGVGVGVGMGVKEGGAWRFVVWRGVEADQ